VSEPNTEWDNVPASRVIPAWREQVRKLCLEINELTAKNDLLKCQVHQMTETGDLMANYLTKKYGIHPAVDIWNIAKPAK